MKNTTFNAWGRVDRAPAAYNPPSPPGLGFAPPKNISARLAAVRALSVTWPGGGNGKREYFGCVNVVAYVFLMGVVW